MATPAALARVEPAARETYDHVWAAFDYLGGRTATFSSIEPSALGDDDELNMGTKPTLILMRQQDAMLLEQRRAANRSTMTAAAPVTSDVSVRARGSRIMIQRFRSAVRVGTPLSCGVETAFDSARACIRANEAITQKTRLTI